MTAVLADHLKKPCRVVDLEADKGKMETIRSWGRENRILILNVAGPRESEAPGIHEQATRFLKKLLAGAEKKGGR